MSGRAVISVKGLGKRYELGETFSSNTARDALASAARRVFRRGAPGTNGKSREFWALKDVSFDVAEGEVVGIIGANGAGKSTLLKILSQITEPTEGEVRMRGRVGALLEVGTGFHQELSGRENIFMNGAILGMSQAEIRRKFDEIVDFAGVEAFIDTPVKRYSSGMLVRLGFAVAAHLEPEILVVDEVLAVGDAEFQRKCLGKLAEVAGGGRTVLFVSHNMAAVHSLCARAALLQRGHVVGLGRVDTIVEEYLSGSASIQSAVTDLSQHAGRVRHSEPLLTSVTLLRDDDEPSSIIEMGHRLACVVSHRPLPDGRPVYLGAVFKDALGGPICFVSNRIGDNDPARGRGDCLTFSIPYCPLMPGRYSLDLFLGDVRGDLDVVRQAASFEVITSVTVGGVRLPSPSSAGAIYQPASWEYGSVSAESASGCPDVGESAAP